MPMEFVQASGALLLWKTPAGARVLDPKWPQKQPEGVSKSGFFSGIWPFGAGVL